MNTRFALLKRLEEVLHVSIHPGTGAKQAVYRQTSDGGIISDATIAKELGILTSIVANNRREVFGNYPASERQAERVKNRVQIDTEIKELRSRIRYIEQQLGIDSNIEEKKDHD